MLKRLVLTCASLAYACGGDYWLGGRVIDRSADASADAGDADAAVGPAGDHVLTEDIVLMDDDSFELAAGDAGDCRLIGDGYSIRSEGTWLGRLVIDGCEVIGLGSASAPAIALESSGDAEVTLEDNTFDASGTIHVTSWGDSSVSLRNNHIRGSSLVDLDASFDRSTPAFKAEGTSTAPKVFQGNRVERSMCWFNSPNWLIGGATPADSNLIVGPRAGIVLEATGLVVRGNYVHNLPYPGSGDESAMSVVYGTSDVLAEHNLLRRGTWVIRGFGGELRYNAILDADNSAWLSQPFENTKVHHNLFLMCDAPAEASADVVAGIHLVNARSGGIEIYNNTLDGGGLSKRITGAPVAIDAECFIESLRSNIIYNFPFWRNDGGAAAIRPGVLEGVEPPPPRMAYADYNLFYNPDAEGVRNYAIAVPDLNVRVDPGFALHDAPSGGELDAQLPPQLSAPADDCFSWDDAAILRGDVTVFEMLSSLRQAYRPAAGSPALQAGDPADGEGNFIGAIGDGSAAADRFGTF